MNPRAYQTPSATPLILHSSPIPTFLLPQARPLLAKKHYQIPISHCPSPGRRPPAQTAHLIHRTRRAKVRSLTALGANLRRNPIHASEQVAIDRWHVQLEGAIARREGMLSSIAELAVGISSTADPRLS